MRFGYEELERDFGRIWPAHVEHFTELLIVLRRHFDGDLDLDMAVDGLLAEDKQEQEREQEREREAAAAIAAELAGIRVSIAKRVGESETLYGSVTATEIAELLHEKGVEVDRKLVFAHSVVPEGNRLPLFLLGFLA